ncbi:hypothetical protein GQ53DRAFT_661529 [Thozetella sp. PMI_491]|nr:hypothetical protein GQ53DRAFT_661529 [Thozetella sp. PMI_491]
MDPGKDPAEGPPPEDGDSKETTSDTSSTAWTTPSSPTPTIPESSGSVNFDGTSSVPTPAPLSSWSAGSDRQLGHGNQDLADRVFPIRSVISVDPTGRISGEHERGPRTVSDGSTSTKVRIPRGDAESPSRRKLSLSGDPSSIMSPTTSPMEKTRLRRLNTVAGSMSSVQADAERYGTVQPIPLNIDDPSDHESEPDCESPSQQDGEGSAGRESSADGMPESLYTHRFKHVMTGDGHAVITGRDGKLQRCEDEPIHAPGAVQAFGLMIAIREEADGCFLVRYASENSRRIIGYAPEELFRLHNFLDILTEEQADNLLDHIDFIRDEDADPSINGPEVFSISIRPPKKRTYKLWCAIHIHAAQPDLVICEFELDDDREYPLRPSDELTPDIPEDTLQSNPTLEELTESTEIMSKPLRVLRSARKRRGEAGAMQVFDIMSQVQEQLASATTLEKFLKILVGIVKELTGFHRVMIYQFDSQFNGRVVTELVDTTQTRDLYKGLHFPASDIPKQARDLYKLNKVRLLYDRDHESARIVCRSIEDLEVPLDMTHSYLRAMSPIHLKYLTNMAVRSSMSISINAFNELWGLISCHSYGQHGMRVSFPIRKMCRLVGDTASRNIERLSYASRLQARKLINTVPTDKNPSGYIIASSDDLLKLFDADCGMLSIRGETKILGRIDQSQEALALLEYLRVRKFTSVVTSQDISIDFPDLRYPPGFSMIAGLLYVPLSVGGNDFIVFFRNGQIKEVKWAGNPYEKIIQEGTSAYLEPRKSFRVWYETVVGKCREWSEEQIETAAVLCLVYGKFIEVWRQKEAALQSSRLTRLLLANSAHEVRTPLNAIINYLEIALEGTLDQETRDNLAKSHSASKSLIYVINDLLDLTKTEEGQELVKDEIFDFPACIKEATEPFKNDAKRKGIEYEVIEHPGLPRYVYGDQRRVRQAVANIMANAVQHTAEGFVRTELYVAEVMDGRVRVEISIQDTGKGMANSQLDALFRDLEQVSTELDEDRSPTGEQTELPHEARTLGLGLALVARIVRNMDGQLRLKSEEGKGSRFVIQLPFDLPPDGSPDAAGGRSGAGAVASSTTASSIASVPATLSGPHEGEVTLVDRGSANSLHNALGLSPKRSFDETNSVMSQRSGASKESGRSGMSDADRLIDAIQMPLGLGNPDSETTALQRRNSRGAYYKPGTKSLPSNSTVRSTSPHDRKERSGPPESSASSPGNTQMTETDTGAGEELAGAQFVTDSKTPIRPVKIPDEYIEQPETLEGGNTSGVLFEISDKGGEKAEAPADVLLPSAALQVLVAEDDPINMKLLRKRLEKAGHTVSHALNGEDCATVYEEKSKTFDVVLMDMQMPIVDGLTSTKMIRSLEQSGKHQGLSKLAANHGRIPIFAVSASLVEAQKDTYVEAGFDGWILKPIDFKRLETLLTGIIDDAIRNKSLYVQGEWEGGGWFRRRTEQPAQHQTSQAEALPEVSN